MHLRLYERWTRVLADRGDSVALVDAETGDSWTFKEVERLADDWLATNDWCQDAPDAAGQVWCLALSDRVAWLSVFLAAIKAGAVVLPLEPVEPSLLREQARRQAASLLIDATDVSALDDGSPRAGDFVIKLTSGTTGVPKALPFTEAEMMADGGQIMHTMSISERDRNYAILPFGHSYGLGNLVMPFFMSGVAIVLGSSPYPQVMVAELTQFPCTVLPLVPPLVKALSLASLETRPLPELRLVISAGSALPATVAQRFHVNTGLRVCNFYGSSETGGICFDPTGELSLMEGAVGTAMEGVELLIGENQSIHVRSEAVCHAVYPDGVCALHDFGILDEDGFLLLTGRHADIVKIAGRRLSLAELEREICAVDRVTDAYVSSRVGRRGETRCIALYCGDIEPETVKAALQSKLPDWKVPKILRKIDQIGYNARGKRDRKAMERQVDAAIAQ